MKNLFKICLLLFVPFIVQAEALQGRVIKIADGDTLTIVTLDQQIQQHKIRLAEIDTPERGQPYYQRAKQALADLVFNQVVDIEVTTTDRYGRKIGMIIDENQRWINAVMVRQGHAWVYARYVEHDVLYIYQEQARLEKIGLWSLPEVQALAPWEFRQQQRSKE